MKLRDPDTAEFAIENHALVIFIALLKSHRGQLSVSQAINTHSLASILLRLLGGLEGCRRLHMILGVGLDQLFDQ
jgi:hypothetical protein